MPTSGVGAGDNTFSGFRRFGLSVLNFTGSGDAPIGVPALYQVVNPQAGLAAEGSAFYTLLPDYEQSTIFDAMQAKPKLCQSFHSIMNIAMMDGSVRTITAGINQTIWSRAINPNDGGPQGQW
jgi:hypothetical protein